MKTKTNLKIVVASLTALVMPLSAQVIPGGVSPISGDTPGVVGIDDDTTVIQEETETEKPTLPSVEPNVLKPDEGMMFVTGAVSSVDDGSFSLSHPGGLLTIKAHKDMEPGDSEKLKIGEHVLAHVAKPMMPSEATALKAIAIHGFDKEEIYAPNKDEEKKSDGKSPILKKKHDSVCLTGSITNVDGDLITLDTGAQSYQIKMGHLGYDLPEKAGQPYDTGKMISIVVPISKELFTGPEIAAIMVMDSEKKEDSMNQKADERQSAR